MPTVNGKAFFYKAWHQLLGEQLDKGLTVRAAARAIGISERTCLKAMRASEATDRPIGRSVRSRGTRPTP